MYIFEEYVRRIGADHQNILRYAEESVVFLKSSNYEIIRINKITNTPGKFKISRKVLNESDSCVEIEWENYEFYINKNFRGLQNALVSKKDVFIGCWEIFLIQNQKVFLEHFSDNFIFKTIDFSINCDERIRNIENSINILKIDSSSIYNSWCINQKHINNYSYWLAEIINEKVLSC